jgi:hypothetical protein
MAWDLLVRTWWTVTLREITYEQNKGR